MNLMPGTLRGSDNRPHVETADGVALPLPAGAPGRAGQAVYYGVRPDHLSVANGSGFEATVDVVEPTGADTLVFARAGNQKICGAFAERYSFKPGERIALAPRLDCVHLFDAQSGVNLMP
jgi:multiple sugar transport system ATP-binding protein